MHPIFICPLYYDLRQNSIKDYYTRKLIIFKLIQLFNSENIRELNLWENIYI